MLHSIAQLGRSSSLRSVDSLVDAFTAGAGRPGGDLVNFWTRWRRHRPLSDLSALIKADLRRRFDGGERPGASEYLAQFPELADNSDRVLSLVYEEFCLLDEHQANPNVDEFCQRYERWKDSIASQLGYHHRFSQVVAADRPAVRYPVVGDRFATYQLRSILGQGGTAQVYLATDTDLGEREVVLKLTPTLGLEPSILASLEHRNIVPIHSVARAEGSALQGICMPYRPGITLEQLLTQLLASGPPRRARIIWDRLGLDRLDFDRADLAWRDFPISGTYAEGVAWLGLEMAQALAYLHGRGVYHRDVKPANILLSARGGPLLIDFNLAHSPHTPAQAREAMSGGTLPYMAPEQLQAFLDPEVWGSVGAKADIYALGLVLRELITGIRPALPPSGLPLDRAIADLRDRRPEYAASSRDLRPDLPPSLDAIIRRCLAFDPQDRYVSAQELGDDLRRFLNRQPLAGATNPSPLERGLNYAYRQRRVASLVGFVSIVVALSVVSNGGRFGRPASTLVPKAPTVQQSAFDALHDPKFLHVLEILRSKAKQEWGEARLILETLREEHPDSAWPLVYLVQVEQQLNIRDKAHNSWQGLAELKPDAEAALIHCSGRLANPIPIYMSLGRVAASRKDCGAARGYFHQVLQVQEDNPFAKVELARVALIDKNPDEAITFYEAAVQSTAPQLKTPNRIMIRKYLMQVLVERLDDALKTPDDPAARERAQVLIASADRHLQILEQEDRQHPEALEAKSHFPYLFAMSRGIIASGRAFLERRTNAEGRGSEEFIAAQKSFDQALELALNMPESRDRPSNGLSRAEIIPKIQSLQKQLETRRVE